ncbi:MAG TPA: MFS transporter [Propionibacteriaceae bacterium]|nr:MFS transporter [Propionibacteriaceae bacterium]
MSAPPLSGVVVGSGVGAYVRLLRYPPARHPFLAALVARLPIAMAPLGILLLVQHERGAYSTAGFVTGAFALGSAVGMPLWGRLMDRYGQIPVLLPTALGSSALLAALAGATVWGASTGLLLLAALLAGITFPPMSPAMRAAWRVILPDANARRVAFALDATSVELIFVGGPLLLSVLLGLTVPVVPLLITAALMATGAVAYCRTEAARRSRPHPAAPAPPTPAGHPRIRSIDRWRASVVGATGVGVMLFVILMLSVGFGQLDTSMAATAGQLLGGTENVGLLFAAIAGGSTVGGLVYGSRAWAVTERRAIPTLLGLFAVLLAVMALLTRLPDPSLWAVFGLLAITGATIAPTLILQQSLLDRLAPSHRLNEAQALLSAATTTGGAAGTALAGLLIDYQGLSWSFGGAAAGVGLAAGIAALSQRRWQGADEPTESSVADSD